MANMLTLREAQIEFWLIHRPECSVKDIGNALNIHCKTVASHQARIYRKRKVRNRLELIYQFATVS